MATSQELLRKRFRIFNRWMIGMWRLGMGRLINISPARLGRILLLGTTGRKSGKTRYTPLNYSPGDNEVVVLSGFGEGAHWLRNVEANPAVEVWLPDGRWTGRATLVKDEPERVRRIRDVLLQSGFAAETFAGVNPRTASDDEIQAHLPREVVVRIHLEDRLRSRHPGWMWAAALGGAALALWGWRTRPWIP